MQVKSYKAGSRRRGRVRRLGVRRQGPLPHAEGGNVVNSHLANQRQGNAQARADRAQGPAARTRSPTSRSTPVAPARATASRPSGVAAARCSARKPRDYSYHMPVKARRVALRSAMAGKLADGEVVIADLGRLSSAAPSSKAARKVLHDGRLDPRRGLPASPHRSTPQREPLEVVPQLPRRRSEDGRASSAPTTSLNGGLIVAESAPRELAERVGVARRLKEPQGT